MGAGAGMIAHLARAFQAGPLKILGCLFGPVLLTGLYCVVTHVVSPRLTHAAAHTQSPLVARLAGNTLRRAEGVANGAVRLADTWPTA